MKTVLGIQYRELADHSRDAQRSSVNQPDG